MSGFCAALNAVLSGGLDGADKLRGALEPAVASVDDMLLRSQMYMTALDQGFGLLSDADLGKRVPTVFVPEGEALLTVLLGNYSHLVAHKYQLFSYLKNAGVAVGTRDLYVFRESRV